MHIKQIIFTISVSLLFIIFPRFIYSQTAYNPPLIHIDKQNYRIGVDRNTGTIYEFFNKRSDPNQNTVHANMGSALQIAVHNGANPQTGCLGMGYWNPTQAGAACTYPLQPAGTPWVRTPIAGQGYDVYCDGVKKNDCINASSTIFHSSFPLMNFDYAPEYPGPYNPGDLLFFEQKLTAKDSYVQVDLTMINKGFDRAPTAVTIPTYYFYGTYNFYSYLQSNGAISHSTFTTNATLPGFSGNFITMSDPQKTNSAITVAWFYSPEFKEDLLQEYYAIDNAPFEGFNYVNFYNGPRINLRANKPYRLRYLVFPFPYDATILTEYGSLTVKQYIDKLNENNFNYLLGDLNHDGKVNLLDYFYFVSAFYHGQIPQSMSADINGDGKIDSEDRTIIINTLKGN